jgi:hypothetical protein
VSARMCNRAWVESRPAHFPSHGCSVRFRRACCRCRVCVKRFALAYVGAGLHAVLLGHATSHNQRPVALATFRRRFLAGWQECWSRNSGLLFTVALAVWEF